MGESVKMSDAHRRAKIDSEDMAVLNRTGQRAVFTYVVTVLCEDGARHVWGQTDSEVHALALAEPDGSSAKVFRRVVVTPDIWEEVR